MSNNLKDTPKTVFVECVVTASAKNAEENFLSNKKIPRDKRKKIECVTSVQCKSVCRCRHLMKLQKRQDGYSAAKKNVRRVHVSSDEVQYKPLNVIITG